MTDEFSTFYKKGQSILCSCPKCMKISRLSQLYIISEAKIEKTGSGWGFFAPATSNNPGTRRSAR